ncbi:MAG: hypothetical protein ACHP9S_07630 [Terriglobales bacterium]
MIYDGGLMNPDPNTFCKDLYSEVRQYWNKQENVLPRTWKLKFGIFYSPVEYRSTLTLMIIGANPGFDKDDDTNCPPLENLFYVWPPPGTREKKYWRIVLALRDLFQRADHPEILKDSVVTNLLFFKSTCLGKDKDKNRCKGWRDNPNAKARREIEDYCRVKVKEIVSQLDPTRILVLGTGSCWDKLPAEQVKVLSRKRKVRLAVMGTVFNKNALGIIHPTGARISAADRERIAKHLGEFLRN